MSEIIKRREWHEEDYYTLEFQCLDDPSRGFSFDCDAAGNVERGSLGDCALDHFNRCENDPEYARIKPLGVFAHHRSYSDPAVLRCDCGREVVLYGFTNTCRCGADYNSAGQRLAHRSQWGEETGESLADILSIP